MARNFATKATSRKRVTPVVDFKLNLSYLGVFIFIIGYYGRPQDFLGGRYLPLSLIGGTLAIAAYAIFLIFGGHINRSREAMVIIALLGWLIVTIPFAYWKGGSFQLVKDNVAKVLLLTIVIMNVITTMSKLRKLLMVQLVCVAVLGWAAQSNFGVTSRAMGNESTAFGNSNDLAVILCINVPLLFFFLLGTNGFIRKLFYLAVMLLMLYTIMLTYSRTGFVAGAVALAALTWHFGIKARHYTTVIIIGALLVVVFLAFRPSGYEKLIASIYDRDVADVGTARRDTSESRESRQLLMKRAVELTIEHPIFGVGLNGFEQLSGRWHVEHNTYLQFSAEAGLPALLLFLSLIGLTFVNLHNTERLARPRSEIWRLVGALRASFLAFLVGAFFTNFGFEFFPYFLFAFAAATHQIALNEAKLSGHAFRKSPQPFQVK